MTGASVLLIGAGDAGFRIAQGLLIGGGLERLTLADAAPGRVRDECDLLACCHDAAVDLRELDGRDHAAVAALIRESRPDLIVQCASMISPWAIIGLDDPLARALSRAGIALQLPAQLPIPLTLMTVVKEMGLAVPVANLSMPDIIHPILATMDLAPTIGLGNVTILHLRARAALRARGAAVGPERRLLRLVGHHHHVYGAMQARPPERAADAARVYLGEDGRPDGSLAYEGTPIAIGPILNIITAAAALAVLRGFLPDAAAVRVSAPAPQGLPGGYPVRIDGGAVSLDLPDGVDLGEAIAFNRRIGALDGVESISGDGLVTFARHSREAVAEVAPELAEPFDTRNPGRRAAQFLEVTKRIG